MYNSNFLKNSFLETMGRAGLHPFVERLRKENITQMSQLKDLSLENINKLCKKINIPLPAVNRLLEILGKTKSTKKVSHIKQEVHCNKKEIKTENIEKKSNNLNKKKTDSNYYHFSSTSKKEAVRYNAKKIKNPSKVQWKTKIGHSSWNPGNTIENKNYTLQAIKYLTKRLINFDFGGIKITKIKKVDGDFTVLCIRGKMKYIYDLSFESEWKGLVDKCEVSGKLIINDIISDDNYEDWDKTIKLNKVDDKHKIAKKIIENFLYKLDQKIIQETINDIRNLVKA